MKLDETETETETSLFYVIVIRHEHSYPPGTTAPRFTYAYFKSDRYTPYSGSLHTDYDVTYAKKWKTPEGAIKALRGFLGRGIIKERHAATACRYTKTITVATTIFNIGTPDT